MGSSFDVGGSAETGPIGPTPLLTAGGPPHFIRKKLMNDVAGTVCALIAHTVPTWHLATINRDEVQKDDSSRHHGWVRWSAEPPAPHTAELIVIWCRTTDDKGTEQPEVGPLNGGYVYSGYHVVTVTRG